MTPAGLITKVKYLGESIEPEEWIVMARNNNGGFTTPMKSTDGKVLVFNSQEEAKKRAKEAQSRSGYGYSYWAEKK